MKRRAPQALRALGLAVVAAVATLAASDATASGRNASYFLPADEISQVRVSPGGDWLVAAATDGEHVALLAQRIDGHGKEAISRFDGGICDLSWLDDDTLLVCSGRGIGRRWTFVTFTAQEERHFDFETESIVVRGYLAASLPYVEDRFLWAISTESESTIHLVSQEQLVRHGRRYAIGGSSGTKTLDGEIARLDGWVEWWVVTRDGVPVAAQRWEKDGGRTIFHRAVGAESFSIIGSYAIGERDLVAPFGVAPDGERLIISAYNGRETIGIYEFDPATRRIGAEIFHRDDVSVDWIHFDPLTDDVQSFSYTSGTRTLRHYLDRSRAFYADALGPDAPPLERVRIVSSTADRRTFVYYVEGPTEPGAHYLRRSDRNETVRVGQKGAGIQRDRLGLAETFETTSADGTVVESILTLANDKRERPTPLIVMPHGGPIGVADRLTFNPVVQYFSSWGMSVLQVNYRGSSGYGEKFMEAGRREWARGIEDDIDAATQAAIARSDIDESRVCIIGGSYGGFSALASVRRHPERFRCAVSINGVTDVPMMAESSDWADSDYGLAWFEWLLGDPVRDRDDLIAISPVYGLANVRTPIMMVYGDSDRRVDPDHSERVLALLELYGIPHEEIALRDVGHVFERKDWVSILPDLLDFVERKMAPAPAQPAGD